MLFGFFSKPAKDEPSPATKAYAAIVAQARRPAFYQDIGAPDTFPGRFEMVVLHVALYLRRLREGGDATRQIAEDVCEVTFQALDADLREMGVGDLAVPKRMKAMLSAFYDGLAAYDAAIDAGGETVIEAAVRRIVFNGETGAPGPARLAAYVRRAEQALGGQPLEALVSGAPRFPDIEANLG